MAFPTVDEYIRHRGLTPERFAELAGVHPNAVKLSKNKPLPKRWADRLGVIETLEPPPAPPPFSPPADGGGAPQADEPGGLRDETIRPQQPPGAPLAPVPVATGELAATRIAQAHMLLGAGISRASGNPAISRVFDDCSPPIGRAWVKAAEENDFCRRVVTLMSAGGATGELVMAYTVLVGGILYVSGRADALAGVYSHKYGPPVVRPTPAPDDESGSGEAAADDSLGDTPFPAAA